jgi:SAM-dependent methyltransferase
VLFACRSCGAPKLEEVLSLGSMPLANALLRAEELGAPEETYPLNLVFCPTCTLVQITETVPPEKLFRAYFYLSSTSETMLRHAEEIATRLIAARKLNAGSRVVEIASNDGYLLQFYQRAGIPVLGIEPATNIARVAEERGIPTRCDFFGAELAEKLCAEGVRADVIHANNVLAHMPDLNGVVRGIARLLKETGLAVIEVPYVREMIDRRALDTIYHEHLCYFSLTALNRLFCRNGLIIQDVEQLDIHGGTLRIYAGKDMTAEAPTVQKLLREESEWGVDDLKFYQGFNARVESLGSELRTLLREIKSTHQRIAAYGASAKGSTLLNYFAIGRETLDFVVDRNPVKQGYYTPGTHLPIHAPERLLEAMPAYALLLTWNFADEILQQQTEYRRRGGRFIIPVPEVQIV